MAPTMAMWYPAIKRIEGELTKKHISTTSVAAMRREQLALQYFIAAKTSSARSNNPKKSASKVSMTNFQTFNEPEFELVRICQASLLKPIAPQPLPQVLHNWDTPRNLLE
jgi:hypothetical protein